MKLFEFIYFCIYKISKSIKRVGVRDEVLVYQFFSGLLFINTMMMFSLIKFFIPYGYINIKFLTRWV